LLVFDEMTLRKAQNNASYRAGEFFFVE